MKALEAAVALQEVVQAFSEHSNNPMMSAMAVDFDLVDPWWWLDDSSRAELEARGWEARAVGLGMDDSKVQMMASMDIDNLRFMKGA